MMPRSQKIREITGMEQTAVAIATMRRVEVGWPDVPVSKCKGSRPAKPRPSTSAKLAKSETVSKRKVLRRFSLAKRRRVSAPEQNAGKNLSHDARLLEPFGKIAQTMHRDQKYGNGEHEMAELKD